MSSVALAAGGDANSAQAATESILRSLTDRSPAWTVSASGAIVVGVGANNAAVAREQIVALPGRAGVLGVDMPQWARSRLMSDIKLRLRHGVAVKPSDVGELFAAVTADCHAVAAFPPHGCAAYRGLMSNRPLFYSIGDDASLLVASQIRGIRNAAPTGLDIAGLAPFLVPQLCDPTGTCWQGIHRLPPGHLLTWWDGQVDVRQVSQIDALGYDGACAQELVREFRNRFMRAVARCSEPPDALLLSGGIDSSALTCAYTSIFGTESGCGYSLTYDQQLSPCDERRFVDDVEHTTGISVHRLAGNRLLPLIASFPEGDEPEPWPYASRNWAMLQKIAIDAGQAPTTVFAGEGGDELLLGQVFSVAARCARGDIAGGDRELATFPEPASAEKIVKGLLTGAYDNLGARMARAVGDIPSWLGTNFLADANVLELLAEGYPRLGPAAHMVSAYSRGLMREMGAAGRVQCGGWYEDMGRRLGLKIAYPFLDPDLAAFTWSLPPQLIRDQGREKVILREALADLLPTSVYERTDKAEALALLHDGLSGAIESIRMIACDGPLVDLGIIHPGRLHAAIDRYLAGDHSLAPALWATTSVDGWLRHQNQAEQR